ncbi:hypothetical protein DYB25_001026 [Aphanomyces astaci]|uniref:Dynein assembly factor 3, axonemal n=1 Tax=Aphanomyces astaci TaxID=112090 RepID=A0A397AVM8_APHAT|nr:hypothetical protein DYB25_001026 [Aphanomyces astaci]
MWGFSPGFDLQEGVSEPRADSNQVDASTSSSEPLCVLVLSPGDIRHVLATIARSRRWKKRPLHIYLYEKSPECLARALLLLQIVNDWEVPLRQRCNTFLEVFGNALVQGRTAEYIEEKAKQLVELVCNESGHLADVIDLSHLKMKSRDALVETFQSWHTNVPFNSERLRDQRLRHYYENRYDYRNNLVDWDYTQFKEWRNTGIAFEFGDQQYTAPNRTMASYTDAVKKGHGSVSCRGYWLDIVVGPYISFGVDCYRNTTEVAVFNVLSHLHEIETGDIYKMKKVGMTSTHWFCDQENVDARKRAQRIVESFEGVKVHTEVILLSGAATDLAKKRRYQRRFHHVYVSVHATNLVTSPDVDAPMTTLLADDAKVSVESSVYGTRKNHFRRACLYSL